MSAAAGTRVPPSLAVHWVKNNILAAFVSAAGSVCIYGIRLETGGIYTEIGREAFAVLLVCAIVLWTFAGAIGGFLTGAVLQRIAPSLPVRTWIALHVVLAVLAGLGSELAAMLSHFGRIRARGVADVSTGDMLLAGFVVGAVVGVAVGGLQAVVLRKAALGTAAWFAWSIVAFAIGVSLFGNANLWETGGGFAGELTQEAVVFLRDVIISLIMLPALQRLRNRMLSAAGQLFA
jgi:hypothetical protein